MLDIRFVRENPDAVKENIKKKFQEAKLPLVDQVIALDEIALPADVGAVLSAAGCGAAILATVHGASVAELRRRAVLRELLESGVCRRAVVIEGRGTERCCRVEELP